MQIKGLVAEKLRRITDAERRSALAAFLVPPVRLRLNWEYGAANEQLDCWLVGQSRDEPLVRIVYCEAGFGPAFPWGYVFGDSMGMDSDWHSGLEDAAIGAGFLP